MEAVGLASAIVTFVDVATRVAKTTYEVHKSSSGTTAENARVADVAADLARVTEGLTRVPQSKIDDPELVRIAQRCNELSRDLERILQKLQARSRGRRESMRVALSSIKYRQEIESIEKRLAAYRQQIILRLNVFFCAQQSPIKATLDEIHTEGLRLSKDSAEHLRELQHQVAKEVERIQAELKAQGDASRPNDTADFPRLAADIERIKASVVDLTNENRVLRRLYFESMFRREDMVHDPVGDSYAWIVDGGPDLLDDDAKYSLSNVYWYRQVPEDEEINGDKISEWRRNFAALENRKRREVVESLKTFLTSSNGVFFIYGKAGCGKSTMVKYISTHQSVKGHLSAWAQHSKLVIVDVFFWNSGVELQRSREGFYRTILFETLRQCPELMGQVFKDFGAPILGVDEPYRLPQLKRAFEALIVLPKTLHGYKFCYFIDGLDEFESDNLDHLELAQQIVSFSQWDNVKILCSARPHTVFLDTFRSAAASVNIHELTRVDIFDFSVHQFETTLASQEQEAARHRCLKLVPNVVIRSDGVFLWATLALRSLLNAAISIDVSFSDLQEKLNDCPGDLKGMFRKLLQNVDQDTVSRHRSNVVLYLAALGGSFIQDLPALAYSWLDDLNWLQGSPRNDFPYKEATEEYSTTECDHRHETVRRLLASTTQGLLELATWKKSLPYYRYRVDFMHRSAREFLMGEWDSERTFWNQVSGVRDETLGRLLMAYVKFAPTFRTIPQDDQATRDMNESQTCFAHMMVRAGSWLYRLGEAQEALPTGFTNDLGEAVDRKLPERSNPGKSLESAWCSGRSVTGDSILAVYHRGHHVLSFEHWACYYGQINYIRSRLPSLADSLEIDSDAVNALLSASVGKSQAAVQYLLEMGRRPMEDVKGFGNHWMPITVSVWLVVLWDFAVSLLEEIRYYKLAVAMENRWFPDAKQRSRVLEHHLLHGAPAEIHFLFVPLATYYDSYDDSIDFKKEGWLVSLGQLLEFVKPPNLSSLQFLLLHRQGPRWWHQLLPLGWREASEPSVPTLTAAEVKDRLEGRIWALRGVKMGAEEHYHGKITYNCY